MQSWRSPGAALGQNIKGMLLCAVCSRYDFWEDEREKSHRGNQLTLTQSMGLGPEWSTRGSTGGRGWEFKLIASKVRRSNIIYKKVEVGEKLCTWDKQICTHHNVFTVYDMEWAPIYLHKNAYKIQIKEENQISMATSSRWFIYAHIMCVTDGSERKLK